MSPFLLRGSAAFFAIAALIAPCPSQATLLGWGSNASGQLDIPPPFLGNEYVDIACGTGHSAALRGDGSAVAWGDNGWGQNFLPALPPGASYTHIAAAPNYTVLLRSDGAIIERGVRNTTGGTLPPGLSYVGLAAGGGIVNFGTIQAYVVCHLALRSDGAVISGGDNYFGQLNVPAPPAQMQYQGVAVGAMHCNGLLSDGSIAQWGLSWAAPPNPPPGLAYVQIAAGRSHSLALRSDGEVSAWGLNTEGQLDIPPLPQGMTYAAVACGGNTSIALRSDGALVLWGNTGSGQATPPAIPPNPSGFRISAGGQHILALMTHPDLPSIHRVGTGCPGSGGLLDLTSYELPRIGHAGYPLRAAGAEPGSALSLFMALALAAQPAAIAQGCHIHLDLTSLLALVTAGISPLPPVSADAAGRATIPLALPAHPGFAGFEVCMQMLATDSGAGLGLTLSNALRLILNP